MTLTPGTKLGSYEIQGLLGAGGMGEVYRARDPRLNRDVAIKVLPAAVAADPERLARFEREAQLLASLNHPNIAAIYGLEESGTVRALVMELVEGPTLAEHLANGALPLPEALEIARQAAEALETAHEKGIVHRDLKPANIKITPQGAVKVLDFGLAKALDDTPAAGEVRNSPTMSLAATRAGIILGTAAYMSPEQAAGKPVDRRADIWSFGVVLWEMLTGGKLFEGETVPHTLADVLRAEVDFTRLPAGTPAPIRDLLSRCLDRDIKTRLRDIGEARIAIQKFLANPAGSSPALPLAAALPAPVSRRSRLPWAAAVLLALALGALAAVHFREAPPRQTIMRFQIPPPEKVTFRDWDAPVLSPDGERLAFSAIGEDQRAHLWIRSLDSLEAQMVSASEGAFFPFWSPDSRSVAFFAQGSLKRVDLVGGTPLTLCAAPGGRGGAWNEQGIIVFQPYSVANTGRNTGPLYQVAATGGEPKPVTTVDASRQEAIHYYPTFLPDGRHFLYLAVGASSGINLGSLDSKESRRLVSTDRNVQFAAPDQLLLIRDAILVAQRFDTRKFELAGEAVPVARQLAGLAQLNFASFSASRTGAIAYRTGTGSSPTRLVWLDRNGKEMGTVGEVAEYSNPALSPDEKRLAVGRRDPVTNTRDIWIFDLTRGTSSRLTFDPADDMNPTWSPDGNWIAFTSDRKGQRNLYRKLASGTGEDEVLWESAERKSTEDWSRDGRTLILNSVAPGKPGTDVLALPLAGDRKAVPVLSGPFAEDMAQLSPNGRWIVYRSNESRRTEIYVQSFPPAGGKWQISASGGTDPQWRRDGKEIFYLSPDNKLMAVEVKTEGAAFEAGLAKVLFEARVPGAPPRNRYVAAANGQRFLVVAANEQVSSAPMNIVLNWQAGLRR